MSVHFFENPTVRREAITPVCEVWECPEPDCGGSMVATDEAFSVMPMHFPHVCSKCGHKATALKKYPALAWITGGKS